MVMRGWQRRMETQMETRMKPATPLVVDEEIGRKLAAVLEEKGWSVRRFCQENDLSRSTVQNIINGRRNPSLSLLIRLAEALEVRAGELL